MREIKFRAWDKGRSEWSQQGFAIDHHGGQCGQVFWHNARFLVEWQERSYDGTRPVETFTDDCFYGQVIGNIQDNPELLEAKS